MCPGGPRTQNIPKETCKICLLFRTPLEAPNSPKASQGKCEENSPKSYVEEGCLKNFVPELFVPENPFWRSIFEPLPMGKNSKHAQMKPKAAGNMEMRKNGQKPLGTQPWSGAQGGGERSLSHPNPLPMWRVGEHSKRSKGYEETHC